jgi:hypothetical protein
MALEKQTLDKSEELTNEYIYEMAVKISEAALAKKLPIKLLGATAFINRCPNYRDLYFSFGRRLTDVDVVTYGSVKTEIIDTFFADLGFEKQQHFIWHAGTRDIFISSDGLLLDVFRDKLEFCHTIFFKNRLDGPWLTIPLEEMLLQKLQIVKINDKDLKDLSVLFLEHEITPGSTEGLDAQYIATLFAKDWGFYHTSKTNLKKFHRYLKTIQELTKDDKVVIRAKIDSLLKVIEDAPKSLGWKLRSKIGTKMKWYNEVEEIER